MGDVEPPSFMEKLLSGDDIKVTGRVSEVRLVFVTTDSSGLASALVARAFMASQDLDRETSSW